MSPSLTSLWHVGRVDFLEHPLYMHQGATQREMNHAHKLPPFWERRHRMFLSCEEGGLDTSVLVVGVQKRRGLLKYDIICILLYSTCFSSAFPPSVRHPIRYENQRTPRRSSPDHAQSDGSSSVSTIGGKTIGEDVFRMMEDKYSFKVGLQRALEERFTLATARKRSDGPSDGRKGADWADC